MNREAPRLARAFLVHALATLRVVPPEARVPTLEAIDRFVAAPGPATFLAATRVLADERRRYLFAKAAGVAVERAFADGIAALRGSTQLPPELIDRLAADLPRDPRSGLRLRALGALARSYEELAARVAADTDEMRRRLRESGTRRSGGRR